MGFRVYPMSRCLECGEAARLIAVCEQPDSHTEARFYECANPACRRAFKTSVPVFGAESRNEPREVEAAPKIRH